MEALPPAAQQAVMACLQAAICWLREVVNAFAPQLRVQRWALAAKPKPLSVI